MNVMPWSPAETAPIGCREEHVYLTDGKMIWMGWWDGEKWWDTAEYAGENLSMHGYPTHKDWYARKPSMWQPSLPENYVPLPEEIDHAGQQLIGAVDEDKLPAQGAMWVLSDLGRWEYLLVTPDIDLVRDRLLDIFRSGRISQAMTIDDVKVVGPNNYTFQLLVKFAKVNFGGRAEFRGPEARGDHVADDGTPLVFWFRPNAVVYRALKTVDGSDFIRPTTNQHPDIVGRAQAFQSRLSPPQVLDAVSN